MSLTLQLAEDDGDAVFPGQAVQLLVEEREQVVPLFIGCRFGLGHRQHLLLFRPPPERHCPGPHGCFVRHCEEPVGDHLGAGDRGGLAGEHEESGLKRVLGVVWVAESAPADSPDHRAVTHNEGLERRLVLAGGEASEELRRRRAR